MASLDSGTDNMIIYGCPPFVAAAKTLEPCIRIASFSAFMALIISSYARQLYSLSRLLFYVVTICPSAVHPVGCYYFTNSNNYQSSIPSEWNVDAECPRRYSKVFVYYNCVFTSTEKSNFVAVGNLVEGGTCITGKTVTILSTFYFYKHSSLKINSVNFQFMRFWIRIQIQVAFYISVRIYRNKTWLHFFNIYN